MTKKPVKIAFISTGYGNSPVVSGGEVRLFNIIKRLPGHFKPFFVTTKAGATTAKQYVGKRRLEYIIVRSSLFFKHELFRIFRVWSNLLSFLDAVFKMKASFFDIIYTSSDVLCDVIPAFIYKGRNNTKWVSMIHHMYLPPFKRPGNFILNFSLYAIQSFAFGLIASRADCVFVLDTDAGRMIEKSLKSRGFKGIIRRVWNGIEPIRNRSFKKEQNMALFVGGLRPSKGLRDIVPIWERVVLKAPKLKLHIVGKGYTRYMDYLSKEIRRKNLNSNIIIEGYLSGNKMTELLKKSFIFFSPSHEEGWSISITEALMYNNHAVAYSLPAFKLFGSQLIKVSPFDMDEFAEKILHVYNSGTLKKTPENFIKKFDWDVLAKKETDILISLQ